MKHLNQSFQNFKSFRNVLNHYQEIASDLTTTQDACVYAICCQLEVTDDVISGEDAETFQEYVYT